MVAEWGVMRFGGSGAVAYWLDTSNNNKQDDRNWSQDSQLQHSKFY